MMSFSGAIERLTYFPEFGQQFRECCSARSRPSNLAPALSMAHSKRPVDEKAAQEPHWPWFLGFFLMWEGDKSR